jgi:aspartate-semialdehyde dehydrogenase
MKTYSVGILGATGAVGQKFVTLLARHPWFKTAVVGASDRSAGKTYSEAANWIEPTDIPDAVASMKVVTCEPQYFSGCDLVFSGLDSSVATETEMAFAKTGIPVISNTKNYRMDPTVPLLVPEVNPDHIAQIKKQSFDPSGKGFIVTNPNCVVVPLVMALRPLVDAFGVESLVVTSMQSVSGAGYPGVPSLDILGNLVPYIGGEEDKIETEPLKLLGTLNANQEIDFASIPIHATATRVPVIEGHTLSVAVNLKKKGVSEEDVLNVWKSWKSPLASMNLPFAPEHPIRVYNDNRYPQPRKHAYNENGMQASIGRFRKTRLFDFGFVVLGHNTVRGAAGGAILNAELLVKKGYL